MNEAMGAIQPFKNILPSNKEITPYMITTDTKEKGTSMQEIVSLLRRKLPDNGVQQLYYSRLGDQEYILISHLVFYIIFNNSLFSLISSLDSFKMHGSNPLGLGVYPL